MAPDAQTHVPLVMWFGRNYHDADVASLRQLRGAKLSHDNVFHTLLGLFEVRASVYRPEMDVLQAARRGRYAELGPATPHEIPAVN